MRICPHCKKEFEPGRADQVYCHKKCGRRASAKRTGRERKRQWRKQGISIDIETYTSMLAAQNGRCLICEEPFESMDVDHCHTTGKIRGLLCRRCNRGLGIFQDDHQRLQRAVAYLQNLQS